MSDLVFFRTPGQSRGRRFMKSDQPMNYTLNFGFRFSCGFWVFDGLSGKYSYQHSVLDSLFVLPF